MNDDIVDDLVSARELAKVASMIVSEYTPAPTRLGLSQSHMASLVSLAFFGAKSALESQSRCIHPIISVRGIGRLRCLVEIITCDGHL